MRGPHRTVVLVVVLALVGLGVACLAAGCVIGVGQPGTTAPPTVTVTFADSGSKVALTAGQTLLVALDSNPSTGYTWQVDSAPSFLKQQGQSTYAPTPAKPNVVGSGGTQTFTFTQTSPGTGELDLVYDRPWEKGVAPARTFTLTVVATGAGK